MFLVKLDRNKYGGGCVFSVVLEIILVVSYCLVPCLIICCIFFFVACFILCINIEVLDGADVVEELLFMVLDFFLG